jgi:hypothetical protein
VIYSKEQSQLLAHVEAHYGLDTRATVEPTLLEFWEMATPTPSISDQQTTLTNISERLSKSGMSDLDIARAQASVMSLWQPGVYWSVRQRQGGAIEMQATFIEP